MEEALIAQKTWAGYSEGYRGSSKAWAQSSNAPDGGITKSTKTRAGYSQGYRDSAKAWAEGTTPPGGGSTKSAKTIVADFQNSLSTNLTVNYVKIGNLPGGNNNQATFINKDQFFPLESATNQLKRYCLMQDVNGYSYLNSPIKMYIRINNLNKI